jgi:hypothetical protein
MSLKTCAPHIGFVPRVPANFRKQIITVIDIIKPSSLESFKEVYLIQVCPPRPSLALMPDLNVSGRPRN